MAKRRTAGRAVTKDAIGKEIKDVVMLGVGVVGGSVLGSMLDKMLKVDHTDTRMDLKKFVRPLVLIGIGSVGSIKLDNENMKNIAKGAAMSGILSGVKVILRKDLLSGLDGFEGLGDTDAYGEPIHFGELADAQVYYEPQIEGTLALPMGDISFGAMAYDPELPTLEALPLNDVPEIEPASYTIGKATEGIEIGEVTDFELI